MTWANLLSNPTGIIAIYGGDVPSLDDVRVHAATMDYDMGLLQLRFDLVQFPENPPKKWLRAGYNAIQLEIQAAGIRELEVRGSITGEPPSCQMNLQPDNGLKLSLESGSFSLSCTTQAVSVANISAYRDTGTDLSSPASTPISGAVLDAEEGTDGFTSARDGFDVPCGGEGVDDEEATATLGVQAGLAGDRHGTAGVADGDQHGAQARQESEADWRVQALAAVGLDRVGDGDVETAARLARGDPADRPLARRPAGRLHYR